MGHGPPNVHNMDHRMAMGHEPIGKEAAMAAPPKPLRTQNGRELLAPQAQKSFHPSLKIFGEHVIRIITKAFAFPRGVWGTWTKTGFSVSAQFFSQPHIAQTGPFQG